MKSTIFAKVFAFDLVVVLLALNGANALAEEIPADGLWRANGALAMALSAGNTKSQLLSLATDATRKTQDDKWSLYAQALGSRADSNGQTTTTANQWAAGARYDHNISQTVFGYGGLDLNRDQIKLLKLRSVVSAGLGYHLTNTSENQWDVFGGLSYRSDQYIDPGVLVKDQLRTKLNTAEAMAGEESTNTLTDSTTFKQRFEVNHGLNSDGGYRATFDASLSVAINKTMSLKVSLQDKYDSLAEAPIKRNDVLFLTGVNVKFGG